MRKLPGKLLCLIAAAWLGGSAVLPVLGADQDEEPAKKDSKEVRTAKQLHIQFTMASGVHNDLQLQEYVQRIGEKLAKASDRPELDWKFTIIDTDDVNAFATMGGYVYISRGILPYIQNEAELAAVLGHEIGHITAKHLQSRQRKSTVSNIASAATAIFTGMPALAELTNMAGSAIISGYGREAELEADGIGARLLAKTGYDPNAMIEVISTLKDQDTFERERARLENRKPRLYHGVFSSHPDNDTRLREAVTTAGRVESSATGDTSNREGFLSAINGLPVGSSQRQGMLRDNRFYHADMQFTLAFPRGWEVVNAPDQLIAIAPNKEHIMEIRTQGPPADLTDPRDFAMRGLGNRRLERPETLDINGLKAWTAVVRNDPSPFGKSTNVRYIIVYYNSLMWVFKGASRSNTMTTPSGDPFFLSTAQTFRRLKSNEFRLAEPYRLHIMRASATTTIEELAKTAAIKKYPVQELRLFNDLYPKGEPKPGDLIKTVR
ncbi:MAG TPA: M48 family metalloprotease [Steroidobacteraceae bacterium]|nr:M48 family metalloprotease [Steroidobacteraceae bacterium]